ncbi:unnamed protein product [Allacma fusca]|uniref:Uncharacterized protein n=1 Tax=Allacma fusca TaxID=39272 RepID=A0A8J2JFP8_9HEXA|nr:unnamed protein product [Allacma fusca]
MEVTVAYACGSFLIRKYSYDPTHATEWLQPASTSSISEATGQRIGPSQAEIMCEDRGVCCCPDTRCTCEYI